MADTCAPSCTVVAAGNAFTPRSVVVVAGSSLRWSTPAMLDTVGHTATSASYCLQAVWPAGSTAVATFRIRDGQLFVQSPQRAEAACPEALAAGDGVFLLPYICLYHPPMKGEILVVST